MKWITEHKLLFGALIIAVVVTVWYGLSQQGGSAPLLTTSAPAAANDPSQDQSLVSTLLALRAVTLSGTIFTDASFESLHDNGTTIVPEPVGRDNPFAPLGSTTVTAAPSSPQEQIFAPKSK